MYRAYISGFIAIISVLSAGTVIAQSYSYPYLYGATVSSACVALPQDMSQGSRGSDVTALQNFLLAQNYPGSGAWMVTGFFGSATRQAVLNFQSQKSLLATGIADGQTRVAIAASTCGGNNNSYVSTPSYNPVPIVNVSTPSYAYPNSGNVAISSLSVSAGPIGTSVTIYGSGFDPAYNNVYFGNTPIPGNVASNGNSLTFTVPASFNSNCSGYGCYLMNQFINPGVYPVYVTNTRGTSNSLMFSVTGGGTSSCPWYVNFGNCGNWNSGAYWNASINSLYPISGGVGTSVTVFGSGFSQRGNTVHFGPGVVTNITSADGTSLSFLVPAQLTGLGSQTMAVGTYNISVTNERGATSNVLPFTVTSVQQNAMPPAITSVNGPVRIAAGTQGAWTVTLDAYGSANVTTSVRWGDEGLYPSSAPVSQTLPPTGTQTLTFTHTYQKSGVYMAIFTASNGFGTDNTTTVTVTVTPNSAEPLTLSNVVPAMGRVGTLVTLTGTGFTYSGNTVYFGSGGASNLASSNNGTTLYFTIPAYVSPCDVVQGNVCALYAQQVNPGTYPLYVRNAAGGQTGTIYFTVTP
ncbi:MAG: Peptidoglycan-binding domain 1 protein [Candidatus Kaiserbacteria bacterium GW2011_GWA2_49_19]|uniref:Peptidoglycan-binding domain 1 protein n=1 Tax=Candidatus Kaiserbacteria bacterium GW2011_GWA2_49_19 TaxID=1618669 RepID=A0A0G1YQ40_9BACT|nr:MAG: Peptidoglycan-binding domain 1 protein [Candidatus Kaiserbacteria bacterium GW2011_GWA2_49_19]